MPVVVMLPFSLLGIIAIDGHIAFSIWYTHSEPAGRTDVAGSVSMIQRRRKVQTCIRLNSEPEHGKDLYVGVIDEMRYPDS